MSKRVVLLTSTQRRHRYVAQRIREGLDLVGVVSEKKAEVVQDPPAGTVEDKRVIDEHFGERQRVEIEYFGAPVFPQDVPILRIPHSEVNSHPVFAWVEALDPDAVLLYGPSIIKRPLLTEYEDRIINMHLGLSPYYRGSGTNFWPLVEGEPELVGTTIHLATPDVDAGSILTQIRPDAEPDDRAHDLGAKAIQEGVEIMIAAVTSYLNGELDPVDQENAKGGKVYRRSDFSADAVRTLWKNLEGGMIRRYAEHQERRRDDYPIIKQMEHS